MKSEYEKHGYVIEISLGVNQLTFEAGFAVALKFPCGASTYHCSSNLAEAILEALAKACLLPED